MGKLFSRPEMGENRNTLGMFDLLKGFMIFTIVWDHTYSSFGNGQFATIVGTNATGFDFLKGIFGFGNATIPLFILISGYGFRPGKIKKVLKNQFETMLKPYAIVAVGSSFVHFFVHYICFKSVRGALTDTFRMAGGFLLGIRDPKTYFGITFFSVGAVWFLLNLFIAWNILNLIFAFVPKKFHIISAVLCLALGVILELTVEPPYCLSQALASVLLLYLGYLIKQYDILSLKFSPGYVVLAIIMTLGAMYSYIWSIGGTNIVAQAMGLFSFVQIFVILYYSICLNKYSFPLRESLARVGRYSLWLMCAEAFTMNVFPWYLVYASDSMNRYLAFFIIFAVKVLIMFVIYKVLLYIEKYNNRKKRAKRQAKKSEVSKEN